MKIERRVNKINENIYTNIKNIVIIVQKYSNYLKKKTLKYWLEQVIALKNVSQIVLLHTVN